MNVAIVTKEIISQQSVAINMNVTLMAVLITFFVPFLLQGVA